MRRAILATGVFLSLTFCACNSLGPTEPADMGSVASGVRPASAGPSNGRGGPEAKIDTPIDRAGPSVSAEPRNLGTVSSALGVTGYVSVEPDTFAVGTNISNAFAGVTLSSIGPGFDGDYDPNIFSIDPSFFSASTGTLVFGTNDYIYPEFFGGWGGARLRVDFDAPTNEVLLDAIADDPDIARLEAFDASSNLVDSYTTSPMAPSTSETMVVSTVGFHIAYVVASGVSGDAVGFDNLTYAPPVIAVAIDLKPGSEPNCVNPRSRGKTPVAVLGALDYEVRDVDQSTLEFGGATVLRCSYEDVEPVDGLEDLICHYRTQDIEWPDTGTDCGEVELTGQLLDGTPILGSDAACLAGEPTCEAN